MKKLLGLIIFSFLLNNISYADNCTREQALRTFKYTVLWEETDGNIPEDIVQKKKELLERTYIFGLSIQKAVKEKDMDKIYSYLADEMPFQKKRHFKDKSFDEVFTKEQRDKILSDTVSCTRFNANGWMLGSGIIWYSNYKNLEIIALRGLFQGGETIPSGSFEVGQNVYFNACGSDPSEYFNSPLKINNILFEVPNKIIKLEKSKYDRGFQTLATSTINILDKQITFNLSNFRDMIIKDNKGIVYEDRKVSGATSIYEIKHQGEVVAWGVGWHKHCKEGYADVDFTAFRLYVPYLDNGELKVQNKLIQLKLSQVKDVLINKDTLILSDGIDISATSSASRYSYRGISFFEIDNKNGINFDLSFEELDKKIDINKLNPALILSTLAHFKEVEKLNDYTKNNFDEIYEDLNANYWFNVWDGYFLIKIDNPNKIIKKFSEAFKKLSITGEKIDKLYEDNARAIPNEEVEIVKRNCFSNNSYKDIFDLISNCYPWHSSWMVNSIGGEPNY